MNYVIEITGGIGKHIMATAFIRWINEKYPKKKIMVVSSYPEIFEYNPRVWRNLKLDQPYLFEDYIKDNDFRKGNPYEIQEFYRAENKMHLMEIFPKAYLFNTYDKDPQMELFLTKGEEIEGKAFCDQHKPLITFQAFGGLAPGMGINRMKIDSGQRDIPYPMAVKICNLLKKKGFNVLQLRGKVEPGIPGTLQVDLPFRNILPIIKNAVAHIGIDSSFMHAVAVFKKPQLIFWGGTHVDSFGYKYDRVNNVCNKHGMHGRPYFAVHDRLALYPYKDGNDGFEFDYTDRELEKHITQFTDSIKNIQGGKNVENNKEDFE